MRDNYGHKEGGDNMLKALRQFGDFKKGLDEMEVKDYLRIAFGRTWYHKFRSFMKWVDGRDVEHSEHLKLILYKRADVVSL